MPFAPRLPIWRLPTAVLLLCALSNFLPAQQSQQYSLMGEIRISRASFPPRRIEVILETRGVRAGATYADDEGKFGFNQLVPNVYYVVIKDPDFEPVRQSYEIRELSGSNNFVQITLIARNRAGDSEPKARISGGNPFLVNTQEFAKHYTKSAIKEFEKGNKAAQKGETEDAIRHLSKAVAIAPEFYEARNNLGLVYSWKKDFAEAEKQFAEVLRINPSGEQAYFNLGNAYLLSGRFPEAEHSVKHGLERRPDSAFGKLLLGTICARSGDAIRAERLLRESLESDPSMSKAHLELVNIYLRQNRKEEAILELKTFLKSSPVDPFAPKAAEVLSRLQRETSTP
jgi:tetratricopeptide (TPR) repeat protein